MAQLALCKKVLGVTIHANMPLSDIVDIWFTRVNPSVRVSYPATEAMMVAAQAALSALRIQRLAYEQKMSIVQALKETATEAALTAAGNFAYAAASQAANIAQQQMQQFQNDIMQSLNNLIANADLNCNG